jgi:hypothetical protein
MKTRRNNLMNSATVATLIALATVGVNSPVLAAVEGPNTVAERTAEADKSAAEKYERDALKFEADADLHSRIAERYRAPSNDGSKQRMTSWSLANHYEWLAKTDREAAHRARNMSAMHRKPTKAP